MCFELCCMELEIFKSAFEVHVSSCFEEVKCASDRGADAVLWFDAGISFAPPYLDRMCWVRPL